MPYNEIRRIAVEAPARRFRILAPVIAVTLCFCAICIYVLINARHTAWDRAGDGAASLATAIESDVARNIETLDLSLQAVVDNLKHPEIDTISPSLRQLVLFDRAATARHVGAIMVLDASGTVRFDSRTLDPQPLNLGDRDYFQAHRDNKATGLFIGRPQTAKSTEQKFVGLSRRLSNSDGSFAGVVMGSLRLSYFKQLFQDISLGLGSNITLSHTDGTMLMRWPYDASYIGRDLSHAELYKWLVKSPRGQFETYTMIDGVHRLVAYRQIGRLPLVVGVGQSTSDIYAQWRRSAWIIGLLLVSLCVSVAVLAGLLLREFSRRSEATRKLATLATIDGLTGLSNRWHFDETIEREWQRASLEREPLALLMIDVDLFKSYNDRHGHQAGDRLLQTIGGAITGSIRQSNDLGARYGGDEFAVLLPKTSLAGATRTAERIRHQFTTDCRDRCAGDDARISVGVACLLPSPSADHSALLGAADGALYHAKDNGRNRIEVAETEFLTSLAAARMVPRQAA